VANSAPGVASGAAQVGGASLAAATSFAPGTASDTGVATGAELVVAATFTPGVATGSAKPVVLEVGGFSVPINRKKVVRLKGKADGAELRAGVRASWGSAAGGAKVLGHSMRSHSRSTFAMAAGRATAASAELTGSLYYWQAAHWTPEQRRRAQAADEQMLETLLLEV